MGNSLADIDYFDPATLSAPYDYYRMLRKDAPVHRVRQKGLNRDIYLVATHALIKEALASPQIFSSRAKDIIFGGSEPHPEADALLSTGVEGLTLLIFLDEPEHRRYRLLMNTVFTPERVLKIAATFDELVDSIIDKFIDQGTCNIIDEFAVPFTAGVILSLIGIDRSYTARVREWSDAFLLRMSHQHSKEEEIEAVRAILDFQKFLLAQIAARRAEPRDDLLSALIGATYEGVKPMSDREIVMAITELIVAGNETSRNTIAGGMVALIEHPEQMQALITQPDLVNGAVEEVIRYFSPARGLYRVTTCATQLGGVSIPADAAVLLLIDSANRDEAVFTDPDRFDIRRKGVRVQHLGFGAGIHSCVGQYLARKELSGAFSKLPVRLKNLRIDAERSDLRVKPSAGPRALGAVQLLFDK